MRKHVKENLLALVETMNQIHQTIMKSDDADVILNLLTDCQDAAEAIFGFIEIDAVEQSGELINNYFKLAFQASQNLSDNEPVVREMTVALNAIKDMLNDIEIEYVVLFLPYKAAMWDSLKSIWEACSKDKRCICKVVPIPYYQYNSTTKTTELIYDFDLYSKDLDPIHYLDYDMSADFLDVIYIHNPYDNYNKITQVPPNFYSENLKKYTSKLVYVPYYITSGNVSASHLELPVYRNMDYMIAQSEEFKESFRNTNYYEKILPLGSPKIDHLIIKKKMSANDSYKDSNKKSIMLNTSLYTLLRDGEFFLEKLKHIFDYFKENREMSLIWRPHPLIDATLKVMRPELYEQFLKLSRYYRDNNVGIFDTSSQLSDIIHQVDGYIGEESSSIVNYFAILGKPVFILNNFVYDDCIENTRKITILDGEVINGNLWFVTDEYNGLFKMDLATKKIDLMARDEEQAKWERTYLSMRRYGKYIYLVPSHSNALSFFNLETEEFTTLKLREENISFSGVYEYEHKVFYTSSIGAKMLECDFQLNGVAHLEVLDLKDNSVLDNKAMLSRNVCSYEQYVWVCYMDSNRILRFDAKNKACKWFEIGSTENGYSGIATNGKYVWLGEVHSGDVYKWDINLMQSEIILMPKDFAVENLVEHGMFAHNNFCEIGKYIITVPGTGNQMVRINKETNECECLLPEFWAQARNKGNGFHYKYDYIGTCAVKLDSESVLVQRKNDRKVIIVNINDGSKEEFFPSLLDETYTKLVNGEDGFEKSNKYSIFARKESRIFTFEGFVNDVLEEKLKNVEKRQLFIAKKMFADSNGQCGKNIHNRIISELKKDV